MTHRILSVSIRNEVDVVAARQRAREIAGLCGFSHQDQVRIATTVSELARNVFCYAGSGQVEFFIEGTTAPQTLLIHVRDQGPGIADVDLVLSGRYQSTTGMGMGLLGAKKLMDAFEVHTAPERGTLVILRKLMPPSTPRITALALAAPQADVALSEVQHQNQELLATLAELKTRQDELIQLTRELEDTNRGVVALYAELDEKADHLRRADQAKSRFLSNMSHEFRTPLSSIRALAKLLLDRVDGELGVEQERQVRFILDGASSLTDLVNDLLDLAKIEAGKVEIRPVTFQVSDMFSALRGMLRPLLVSERLQLSFEAPDDCEMHTDEGKVAQILRNFISNAIKFTESGSITVRAEELPASCAVRFSVTDTGIGIEAANLPIIFEEFSQVENHLQRHVKGTGLGLPLCQQLANVLNGAVGVSSQPGVGSTFTATIPVVYGGARTVEGISSERLRQAAADDGRRPVLVVEDRPELQLLYERYLHQTEFRAVCAASVEEAEALWRHTAPCAVLLDLLLGNRDSWHWLVQIKRDDTRRQVPVIIASDVDDKRKALGLGADAYFHKPLARDELLAALRALAASHSAAWLDSDSATADAVSE